MVEARARPTQSDTRTITSARGLVSGAAALGWRPACCAVPCTLRQSGRGRKPSYVGEAAPAAAEGNAQSPSTSRGLFLSHIPHSRTRDLDSRNNRELGRLEQRGRNLSCPASSPTPVSHRHTHAAVVVTRAPATALQAGVRHFPRRVEQTFCGSRNDTFVLAFGSVHRASGITVRDGSLASPGDMKSV